MVKYNVKRAAEMARSKGVFVKKGVPSKAMLKAYPTAVLMKNVQSLKKVAVQIPGSPGKRGRPRKITTPVVTSHPSQIIEAARKTLASKLYRPAPKSKKRPTVEATLTEEESPEIVNPPKQRMPSVSRHLGLLCRVCGRTNQDLADVVEEVVLGNMLVKHLNIAVRIGDGLPHKVCQACSSLLMDWDCLVAISKAFEQHLRSLTAPAIATPVASTVRDSSPVIIIERDSAPVVNIESDSTPVINIQRDSAPVVNIASDSTARDSSSAVIIERENTATDERVRYNAAALPRLSVLLGERCDSALKKPTQKVSAASSHQVDVIELFEEIDLKMEPTDFIEIDGPECPELANEDPLQGTEETLPKQPLAVSSTEDLHTEDVGIVDTRVENEGTENASIVNGSTEHTNETSDKTQDIQITQVMHVVPEEEEEDDMSDNELDTSEFPDIDYEEQLNTDMNIVENDSEINLNEINEKLPENGGNIDLLNKDTSTEIINDDIDSSTVRSETSENVDDNLNNDDNVSLSSNNSMEVVEQNVEKSDQQGVSTRNSTRIKNIKSTTSTSETVNSNETKSKIVKSSADKKERKISKRKVPTASTSTTTNPENDGETSTEAAKEAQENETEEPQLQFVLPETSNEAGPSTTREFKKSVKNGFVYKKQYCLFCVKPVTTLIRHLETKHKTEPKVKELSKLPRNSKPRHLLCEKLRKEGNYKGNMAFLKTGKGVFIPVRRQSQISNEIVKSTDQYVSCEFCLGFVCKKDLKPHLGKCKERKESDNCNLSSYLELMLPVPGTKLKDKTEEMEELLDNMKECDEIKEVIKNDDIIYKLGIRLLSKSTKAKSGRALTIRVTNNLKDIALLLINLRKEDPNITDLSSVLHQDYWIKIITAIRSIAGFEIKRGIFKDRKLVKYLGINLKKCAFILKGLENENKNVDIFIKLFYEGWHLEQYNKLLSIDVNNPEKPKRKATKKSEKHLEKNMSELKISDGQENSDVETEDEDDFWSKRRNFCWFCERPVTNLKEHLESNHPLEPRVKEIMLLPKGSMEKIILSDKIFKVGNYKHNVKVLETGNGIFMPARYGKNYKINPNYDNFIPCIYCLGFYDKGHISNHRENCFQKPSDEDVEEDENYCNLLMPTVVNLDKINNCLLNMLENMTDTAITQTIKNDELILKFGLKSLENQNINKKLIQNVSTNLKDLSKLLLSIQNNDSDGMQFDSFLHNDSIPQIIEGIQEIARYDEESKTYDEPEQVTTLLENIKKCAYIAKGQATADGNFEKMEIIGQFMNNFSKKCQIVFPSDIPKVTRKRKEKKDKDVSKKKRKVSDESDDTNSEFVMTESSVDSVTKDIRMEEEKVDSEIAENEKLTMFPILSLSDSAENVFHQ